jgi:hypothetical protein
MARLYDWEAFLTIQEQADMALWKGQLNVAKNRVAALQAARDDTRRKAVQRARNALNKQLRAQHREKSA